jgi:hypothetical protein
MAQANAAARAGRCSSLLQESSPTTFAGSAEQLQAPRDERSAGAMLANERRVSRPW